MITDTKMATTANRSERPRVPAATRQTSSAVPQVAAMRHRPRKASIGVALTSADAIAAAMQMPTAATRRLGTGRGFRSSSAQPAIPAPANGTVEIHHVTWAVGLPWPAMTMARRTRQTTASPTGRASFMRGL
jgi:hypothetical protein